MFLVSRTWSKRGLNTHVVQGEEMTVIGCIGDTAKVDSKLFEIDSAVDKVMHVQEPYKLANRAFHPEDSIIDVSGVKVGGDNLAMIYAFLFRRILRTGT